MSIENCVKCGAHVDTDFDSEAYVLVPIDAKGNPDWVCMCKRHREEYEHELDCPE